MGPPHNNESEKGKLKLHTQYKIEITNKLPYSRLFLRDFYFCVMTNMRQFITLTFSIIQILWKLHQNMKINTHIHMLNFTFYPRIKSAIRYTGYSVVPLY